MNRNNSIQIFVFALLICFCPSALHADACLKKMRKMKKKRKE
ncbi:MAG: hypothetical protein V2I97_03795 [Desulfococcaceae bacterium]|nr:hypothetical protein [Desulfococcaceae bacterium]